MARYDLGLSQGEIDDLSLKGIHLLMRRRRDAMKFEAKIHGFEIQEDEGFATEEQVGGFFDALVKATNGGASPTPRG